MTCLEWAGIRLVLANPEQEEPDEEDFDFEDEGEDEDEDEEYVDHDDDGDGDDEEEDGTESEDDEEEVHDSVRELHFKKDVIELPRPLQLNKDYDAWSSAVAPPVFKEEE